MADRRDTAGEPATQDLSDTLPASTAEPAAPGAAPPPGTTIGRYVLLEAIGAGAMGVVYAAYDSGARPASVAVKLLSATRAPLRSARRLVREAQAMAKLSHPNVVAVYDVGTHRDQVFIAMEFVEGATLREWLARAPRAWRESRSRCFAAPGAGSRPRTPPASCTATSSRTTCSSSDDGRVRVARLRARAARDDGVAASAADGAGRRACRDPARPGATAHARPAQSCWARRPTWRRSSTLRRAGRRAQPISSASASRCTRRCTASGRSPPSRRSRCTNRLSPAA